MMDCTFPGGNIIVERMEGDTVYLHQDIRDTTEWWFYWYFRVRGASGRTLTFRFTQGDVIGSRGPAVSAGTHYRTDAGTTWRWLGRDAVDHIAFTYTFAPGTEEVRFAFSLPYVESDLRSFLVRHAGSPYLRTDVLCTTRNGRAVELLHIGQLEEEPAHRVLLTCRHHACESVASYVLEGLMALVLAGDDAAGIWLRDHVAFRVVPFVDKDGVEAGDQGKYRHPRDHNRDYDGTSLYATTAALRETVPAWAAGKLRVALDLHCPYIRGDHSEIIYFVGGPDRRNWNEVCRFSALLEESQEGPLPYRAEDNMPFGQGWNTADNTAQGRSFSRWAEELPGIRLATSLETPYADVAGTTVTVDTARALGRDLARALYRYLQARV